LPGSMVRVQIELDQVGQEPAHRRGAAVEVHAGEEQLLAGQLDVVGDPDVADVPARPAGADGLHHRLLGADDLDDRMRAEPVGQVLDARHPLGAALDDDVGGAELPGQLLPRLVAAHRDDPLGTELLRREDAEQADGTVADHPDGPARAGVRCDGGEPAGAQHIGGREQAGDQVVGGQAGGGDEGSVGQRDAEELGLDAGGGTGLPVDAVRLVPGAADLAGVVRGEEGADDELSPPNGLHPAANFFDDAAVLVAHRHRSRRRLNAAVRPQVRSADARGRQADDRVRRLDDGRLRAIFEADVARAV
jgi:hypothetical protein